MKNKKSKSQMPKEVIIAIILVISIFVGVFSYMFGADVGYHQGLATPHTICLYYLNYSNKTQNGIPIAVLANSSQREHFLIIDENVSGNSYFTNCGYK